MKVIAGFVLVYGDNAEVEDLGEGVLQLRVVSCLLLALFLNCSM
jgi:hypothetical protein